MLEDPKYPPDSAEDWGELDEDELEEEGYVTA